jgi:hypothetical protein
MDTLYSWSARRAGGRITVKHSCGKISNIDVIEPRVVDGAAVIVATQASGSASNSPAGREFKLHVG